MSGFGFDETLPAFDNSAAKLEVEHIDLVILQQPAPDRVPRSIAAYRALESFLTDGRSFARVG